MDITLKDSLIQGLKSEPKYIPTWFRYDKQGSIYYDQMVRDSKTYYINKSEIEILKTSLRDMVDLVQSPCDLIDMGSGDSVKGRMFIDAILDKQETMKYIPVDVSEDYLKEVSKVTSEIYGNRLEVQPIPGDYNAAIEKLRYCTGGNKLIVWLGGFINVTITEQKTLLSKMEAIMSDNDRLLLALDITEDKDVIEAAYLDKEGIRRDFNWNGILRLNRDFGCSIDTDKFDLQGEFSKSTSPDVPSRMMVRAVSKCHQSHHIPGLGITLTLSPGEGINLYENDGGSFKYTLDQISAIAKKARLVLDRHWVGEDRRAAFCALKKDSRFSLEYELSSK